MLFFKLFPQISICGKVPVIFRGGKNAKFRFLVRFKQVISTLQNTISYLQWTFAFLRLS